MPGVIRRSPAADHDERFDISILKRADRASKSRTACTPSTRESNERHGKSEMPEIVHKSWITAPSREVTTPIL